MRSDKNTDLTRKPNRDIIMRITVCHVVVGRRRISRSGGFGFRSPYEFIRRRFGHAKEILHCPFIPRQRRWKEYAPAAGTGDDIRRLKQARLQRIHMQAC